jgi:hypothetical protein
VIRSLRCRRLRVEGLLIVPDACEVADPRLETGIGHSPDLDEAGLRIDGRVKL